MSNDDDTVRTDATKALLQSQENATQIKSLADTVRVFIASVDEKLDRLGRDIRSAERSAAPNFATMAAWAGIVLGVVAFFANRELDRMDKRFEIEVGARKELFMQMNTRTERLENIQDDLLKDEARRYRDLLHETISPKETHGTPQ